MIFKENNSGSFSLSFGSYELYGRKLSSSFPFICNVLAIHGARTNHLRLNPLLFPLQALGVGSVAIDLSGHTEDSPIPLGQSSLKNNLYEAIKFAEFFDGQFNVVFGHSLGGALALKVAQKLVDKVHTLILSGPAIYPEAAYQINEYGSEFKSVISKPYGYLDSESFEFLNNFNGNVILIVGEYDGLPAEQYGGEPGRSAGYVQIPFESTDLGQVYSPIPLDVFKLIAESSKGKFSRIIIENSDHKIFSYLERHRLVAEILAKTLVDKIINFSELDIRISINGVVGTGID